MTRDEVFANLTHDTWYINLARSIAADLAEDLFQDMAVMMLELPTDKLQEISTTCLKCWYAMTMKYQFQNPKNQIFKKYIRYRRAAQEFFDQEIPEQFSEGYDLERIEAIVRSLTDYQQDMITRYAEAGGLRPLSQLSGIPRSTLALEMTKIKKHVREQYNS